MFTCVLHYKIILHYVLLPTKSLLCTTIYCTKYIFFAQFHVQISILHNFMNSIYVKFLNNLSLCMCSQLCIVGMCISITEADAIRISMHSQRYDTLKIHMKQLPMRCDAIRFTPITMQCDSIQFNTMQFDAIRRNGKNMIAFISLVQTDSKS